MKYPILRTVAVALSLVLAATAMAGEPKAQFEPLGFGDGHFWWTSAFDVSDDGRIVVGQGGRADTYELEAWRWVRGRGIEGLGDLPGWDGGSDYAFESRADAVSGNGKVVIGQGMGYDGAESFAWTQAHGMVGLGFLEGGSYSRAAGADRLGKVIVGTSGSFEGGRAYRWTRNLGMQSLGTLGGSIAESHGFDCSANGNVVVGLGFGPNGQEAFRWTPAGGMEGLGHPEGASKTIARAVSADGSTIVGQGRFGTRGEALRWTQQTGWIGLGDLPGGNDISIADGVSGDGAIVVGASETHNPYGMGDAFIWDEAHGMRLLQQVLTEEYGLDLGGWTLERAYAITPNGLCIVGDGTNPEGEHEAWLVRLPRKPAKSLPNWLPAKGNWQGAFGVLQRLWLQQRKK